MLPFLHVSINCLQVDCLCVLLKTCFMLLGSSSFRCPVPSHHCSWPWLSWRPGTLALPCSTVKRPSQHQKEHSLTLHSSISCTFLMTRSLLSTYRSSCPCVCPFCCHCSKSCLRFVRDAEKSKPRRTEDKNSEQTKSEFHT